MSLTTPAPTRVDVRGPRFAAWITTTVLVAVLVVASFAPVAAGVLLAAQAIVFALGAALGPRRSPYGALFASLVAPRLSPVGETEPVEPLRFAQGVGLAFAAIGTLGFLAGATTVGLIATGFALFAALLNAAFGVCLGCRMYPLLARLRPTAG
ncbi:MAG: DUF4395 domain-containing protein [Rhodococcus sp.]|uniref:DUF4395 domain-containing protein n=1 Tax=Rhodococcus TaxID=1827 RepID=UPI0016B4F3D1|nr:MULTISPECIES: DUF4395 domain-containing protein [Rhodococcus]NLV79785.1 DUF4395 domain-containing protein [Rhodococcus sp. (in: high G+C Gram-positive bacteria)]